MSSAKMITMFGRPISFGSADRFFSAAIWASTNQQAIANDDILMMFLLSGRADNVMFHGAQFARQSTWLPEREGKKRAATELAL
jgi:hypothetical protein